jgi:hypothetical protein
MPNPTEDPRMEIYNRLRTPPPDAIKPIMGGHLKGKSDVNPMWRWQALTEVFGPVGSGWEWEQLERWTVDVPATGEVMLFIRVRLRYRDFISGEWSTWVYGSGGSMLIEADKNGLHGNDEAVKMAETDALGNAAKYLGLASDVYRGFMDGSKYQPRQERPMAAHAAAAAHGPVAKAESRGQAPARPTGRQVPQGASDAECRNCQGPMWDNRRAKRYPNDPDWKCKDAACFSQHGGFKGTSVWTTDAEYRASLAGARTIPEDSGPPIDGPPPGWDPARDGFGDADDAPPY